MVTISDVAKASGVSISTVSRVLNSDETIKVSSATRAKILETAEALKYVKPINRKETSKKIILSHWYNKELGLTDLYLASVRWGVETYLKSLGYQIIRNIFNEEDPNFDDAAGIIAIGGFDEASIQKLKTPQIPLVIINQNTLQYGISCVTADYNSPVKEIIAHLKNNGHQKIGLIDGCSPFKKGHVQQADPRATTFKYTMLENNELDEKLIFYGDFSIESGYKAMQKAITTLKDQLPSAFFVISDTMAIGALRALKEANIKVPEQVSLIGFGDLEVGQYFSPSLSTVQLAKRQMGTLGAMTLQNIINGVQTQPINIVTGTKLVIRESSN